MASQQELPLPASTPSDTTVINGRCVLRAEGGLRVLLILDMPVHHYDASDVVAEAYAMVFLVNGGHATQREVAAAFRCCDRTIRRNVERYNDGGGMAALAKRSGWCPGRRKVPRRRALLIARMKSERLSNREISRRLGISETAVRKQVGPAEPRHVQQQLDLGPPPTAAAAPPAPTAMGEVSASESAATTTTPLAQPIPPGESAVIVDDQGQAGPALSASKRADDRTADRLAACLGLLDDAAPMFADATAVRGAGVLCAVPLLVASGVFRIAQQLYGEIGPAFYGTRTTLMALLIMALARIKRPEALKERDPQGLGRLLGLDRAPEVKTVRRKLTRLASYHKGERLGQQLAQLRVQQRGQLMGFLYVDGHVRVYHGKHELPKAHVTQMRLALPATTDYWINHQGGDPLFVMTAPANAGMTKMLPTVLVEIRKLIGQRRITIVFDRGGWSPKMFQKILADGFDILTYRKGKARRIPEKRFVTRKAKLDGRAVEYNLHDQTTRLLKGKLTLRQITRLVDGGHQTQILTSRRDLSDIEIAFRMFERWRQENFFKYLNEEFMLDALADHRVEPDDPTRTVPNPIRHALDKEVKAARAEVAKLEQAYGAAAAANPEAQRPSMRGFKIANSAIGKQLDAARQRLAEVLVRRRTIPKRVEVRDVRTGTVVKLATEKKHLTNILKMVAFQAESDLYMLLGPHYARSSDEGRTLLHELFAGAGDMAVAPGELRITLHPLSAPHRTLAVNALCEKLTAAETVFPGTQLKLRFAIQQRPEIGLAFPGPRPPRARPTGEAQA